MNYQIVIQKLNESFKITEERDWVCNDFNRSALITGHFGEMFIFKAVLINNSAFEFEGKIGNSGDTSANATFGTLSAQITKYNDNMINIQAITKLAVCSVLLREEP